MRGMVVGEGGRSSGVLLYNPLLHAHAQLMHTLPCCTAVEFMCVVFGTSIIVNAMTM